MKICPKCGWENVDTAASCSECFSPFTGAESAIETDSEAFFQRVETKQRRRRLLALLVIPFYYIIYIILSIKYIADGSWFGALLFPLLFPVFYYLMMFKADLLFKFQHMLQIDNINDVDISEWYYMGNKIGAVLLIVIGLACIAGPSLPFWSS